MQSLLRISFRTRLIFGAIASVFMVVTPMFMLDVQSDRRQQSERLNDHADLSIALLSQTVALPLWDFNYSFLEDFFIGLSTDDLIHSAILLDATGTVVVEYNTENISAPSPFDVEISQAVLYGEGQSIETIGTLTLIFSGRRADLALWDYAVRKLISLIVLLGLAGVVLMAVISRILVPIQKLIVVISAIREGDFDVAVPGIRRSDEIGAVAEALDQLRLAEAQMQELRSEQDAETRRDRYRMVRALESTNDAVMVLDEVGKLAMQNKQAASYFGALAKGDDIDLSALIEPEKSSHPILLDRRIDTTVSIQNTGREYDLRVRMDPIKDETGTALGHVFLASDITEQLRQTRRADFLASHDSLTELANRRVLETELARNVEGPVALLIGDLDQFKQVNDTLGHDVGDQLLKKVAGYLRDSTGGHAIPIRLGGDEFAIIAHGPQARQRLATIGEGIVEKLVEPLMIDGRAIKTGMSMGLASCPEDIETTEKLVQMADLALYDAKRAGRGMVKGFRATLNETVLRHRFIETELGRAIKNGTEPWPVYQKQTDAQTGALVGFEALARWEIPDEGMITPGEFIPIAEESGLIADITSSILNHALKTAKILGTRGFQGRVAVNMSPSLFNGEAFNLVRRALEITKCPSHLVEIEITEQLLLSGQPGAHREVEKIRNLGVNVALDDFGVGYSSLSYLIQFPVDKIKIDRIFVADLESSDATRAIVTAISQLGHALNMTVVGEGVETNSARIELRNCGIDVIQGWVDGKPLPEETVLEIDLQTHIASPADVEETTETRSAVVSFPAKR